MPIVAKGQITITDLNDGINGDNGKTYVLNILNGVRSVVYDANGKNPSPSQTAFSCELYEDGVLKTPSSYSWSATGLLSGTSTSSTFTPTCAAAFSSTNNSVSLTVVYNKQTIRATIPIAITRIGASGNNAIIAVLSNETHTIPTDNSGNNGNFTGANTTMYIYNGATDDSSNWTVSATASNVTGSLSGKTYTITAMSADTGYVDLTASRSGYTSITKRFTLTKSKQGAAGSNGSNGAAGQNATAYKLISNVAAIAKSISNVYTPSTITISATSATGTAAPKAYAGRFIISETTDGKSYTAKYTSSANESSKIYTPSAGIKAINAKLYLAGGTSTLLDEQTIPIVSDGATGDKGDKGDAGTPAKYVVVSGEQVFRYDNSDYSGTPTPSSITISATLYGTSGYQWSYRTPGSTTNNNIRGATSSSYAISHNNSIWGTNKQLTFRCTSGGVYDEITIVKVADGAKGDKGDKGDKGNDAYTVIITNESHTFPGSTTAAIAGSTKCEIIAYKGATRVSATIGTISGLPKGMTAPITNNGTTTAYFSPTVTTSMSTVGGVLTVPITVDGKVFTKYFTYSLALKGNTGNKGDKGDTGATGKGIVSITALYKMLSTKAQQPTPTSRNGWSTTPPTWKSGMYMHTCSEIVYQNPSSTIYTVPLCDNSWEAVNDFNTQENIFNTLTNNGATQGIYMQNNKLYLNGEYLKAGTVSADKLLIGIGDGGGLSQNPSFKKWSGTYPDGTVAWSSGGISKQTVDGRNVAQFTCSTSGTQYGMQLPSTFFANNINLDGVEYFALEVKFRLTSGTSPSGAAFLFDVYATDGTYQRLQLNMTEAGSSLTTNTWYTVKKVFKVSTTKTFKSCSGYLLANWSSAGNAVKTIQFATANVYIATKQDYLTQSWTTGTEINGASIKTGTLSASKITTGTLDASKVVVSNLNAGNITSGTISADRISVDTLKGKTITSGTISGGSITGATIKGGSIGIGGTSYNAFTVDTSGNLTINGGVFKVTSAGALTASNATITGKITASSGKIAGYTISGNQLVGTNVGMSGVSGQGIAFWAGHSTPTSAPFQVSHSGVLTATGANITGVINAESGTFSGNITSSATIEGGTIKGARVESSYHIRGDYPPDPPEAEGPVGYSYAKKLLLQDNNTRAMNDVNDYSYSVSLSGANFKSSVYKTYMGDPSMGYYYDTLDIWGSNMTMVSGYSPGNAQDNVLVISPEVIKMQDSQGNYPIKISSYDGIAGRSAVTMELGLTVYNDLILNNFLTLNAWSGYGSGKAQLWYDGNKKALIMQPPVEDIIVNGKYVYRNGRYPGRLWIEGTNTISSPTNDTTSNWGAQNNSIHFYTTAGCLKNQPTQWGYLLNIGQGAEVHQVWMEQADGSLHHRGGNAAGWHGSSSGGGTWKTILDSSNFTSYAISKSASCNKNWYWSGQGGQPNWIWGGNDGTNMYVYNPSNFSVAWATGALYANEWRSTGNGTSYITTGNGDGASWSTHNVIFRTHWGLGVRDYSDTCRFLIDARTGNTFAKGYFMGTAFNTSSDKRLKEEIAPIDERLEKMFMELKAVNYYMINQEDHRRHNGFIAQDVEEAMLNNNISYEEFAGILKRSHGKEEVDIENVPRQILEDETDEENIEYSLNYGEFTALNTHMIQKCLNLIQEQSEEIKGLKEEIMQLKNKHIE